jgi:hypothetical protein
MYQSMGLIEAELCLSRIHMWKNLLVNVTVFVVGGKSRLNEAHNGGTLI